MTYFELLAVVAQEAGEAPKEPGSQLPVLIGYIAIVFFIFWLVLFRPRKQEQKHREQMLSALKKHDKVMTIGGIIGTVMEVREDEVILKVDDNTNTRMKFSRGAIQKVLSAPEGEKESKA